MDVFPYDDERLTLFAVVGDVGYTGTLRALAAVAEIQAEDPQQPADIRENAAALAARLRDLALDVTWETLLP